MAHHKFTTFVVALAICAGAGAAGPELNPDHPRQYIVQPGDTLWGISARFLQEPWRWREIWHANPAIADPNRIYPGDVIVVQDGASGPELSLDRSGRRSVKLSPTIRRGNLEGAVPTIPIDAIRPFLISPRVFNEQPDVREFPQVVAFSDEHLVGGMGNTIYVINLDDPEESRFTIVRKGRSYVDPASGELLGYEAEYVGDATLQDEGDPATLRVTHSVQEVMPGDRILTVEEEEIHQNFQPKAPSEDIEGRILAVLNGIHQIGKYDVVAVSLGEDDGVAAGDVLAVYQTNRTAKESNSYGFSRTIRLPAERAGLAMIFRTFDRISYALIMDAERNMLVGDLVTNP